MICYTVREGGIVLVIKPDGTSDTMIYPAPNPFGYWCTADEIVSREWIEDKSGIRRELIKVKKSFYPEGYFSYIYAEDLMGL